MSLRVLVFGSRDWDDPAAIHAVLDGLYTEATAGHLSVELATFTVIEGGAKGADAAAAWWAGHSPMHSHNEHPDDPTFGHLQFPADWPPKGSPRWLYATAAHDRNQRMVTEGRPDIGWGFVTRPLPESRGSADMARRLQAALVPVYIVQRAPGRASQTQQQGKTVRRVLL